jgi:DNA-directed RNA polymerase sigma subunit (sigma70/sigma32)
MLSRTLKRFVRAAESAGEEDYPVNLAKSLDLLGLTCSRMASVLRVNIMLLSPGKDDGSKELLKCLADFSQELRQITEESHD